MLTVSKCGDNFLVLNFITVTMKTNKAMTNTAIMSAVANPAMERKTGREIVPSNGPKHVMGGEIS